MTFEINAFDDINQGVAVSSANIENTSGISPIRNILNFRNGESPVVLPTKRWSVWLSFELPLNDAKLENGAEIATPALSDDEDEILSTAGLLYS